MSEPRLPLVLEPAALEPVLNTPDLLVVDLRKAEDYARSHVPGAVHLDRNELVAKRPPVGGLLPDDQALSRVLGGLGLGAQTHVVAYDDEGGGWAGRLLWTLDVLAHPHGSLLNGGWLAWANEGHPVAVEAVRSRPSGYRAVTGARCHVDAAYILANLGRADLVLLDTRTHEEFIGEKRLSARGGHIPGAVNLDWVQTMDPGRSLRFKASGELRERFAGLGITPDKEVIVYCQTHHRSSQTYVVLKSLGYARLNGYPGAWSDWGNRVDTPVEA